MVEVKIGQIRAGMRNMRIIGRLKEVSEEDGTGSVRLNLWRGQIEIAKAGDTIVLENAFAREFGGGVEVNIGADGKIAVLDRG